MTTTEAVFGNVTYPANRIDIWRESQGGIGRFEVLIDGSQVTDISDLFPQKSANLKINGISMMQGYIDDVLPNVDDESAVHRQMVKITGRDKGQDLANLFLTKEYVSSAGAGLHWDDILYDALMSTVYPSEITYTLTSVGNPLDYSFKNQYLLDGFKEMAKLVGFDFYVNDQSQLKAFLLNNAPGSGITLNSTYNGVNNILALSEIGYAVGFDIRNYIQVEAGDVDDHWTEGNAIDYDEWESSSTSAIADDTTDGFFLKGRSSIKATWGSGVSAFFLQFPRYSYDVLDYSKIGEVDGSAYVMFDDTGVESAFPCLYIRDDNGNEAGWRIEAEPNKWHKFSFKLGVDQPIYDNGNDRWNWLDYPGTHSPPFSWVLDRIGIQLQGLSSSPSGTHCWFDGLNLSGITARAIAEFLSSQGRYRARMIAISRSDLKSIVQLGNTAWTELAHRMNPTQTLKVTAPFQSGADYAGKTIVVNSPLERITNETYRILSLHHTATPGNSILRGFDTVTEFDLVRADQAIDPLRAKLIGNPTWVNAQRDRERIRSLEQGR